MEQTVTHSPFKQKAKKLALKIVIKIRKNLIITISTFRSVMHISL